MKMEKTRSDDHSRRAMIDFAIDCVTAWKRLWRREKGKGKEFKLARSMEEVPDIQHSTDIVTHMTFLPEE